MTFESPQSSIPETNNESSELRTETLSNINEWLKNHPNTKKLTLASLVALIGAVTFQKTYAGSVPERTTRSTDTKEQQWETSSSFFNSLAKKLGVDSDQLTQLYDGSTDFGDQNPGNESFVIVSQRDLPSHAEHVCVGNVNMSAIDLELEAVGNNSMRSLNEAAFERTGVYQLSENVRIESIGEEHVFAGGGKTEGDAIANALSYAASVVGSDIAAATAIHTESQGAKVTEESIEHTTIENFNCIDSYDVTQMDTQSDNWHVAHVKVVYGRIGQ